MHLKVERRVFSNRSTIGDLFVDGAFECVTLEDMVRPVKVPGMTAIPEGVYVLSVSFSNRFQKLLPEVHNVPNFTGVRIHSGNTDADTEGCILVGRTEGQDSIGGSRGAFTKLFARIQEAAQREKIFIEVTSRAIPAIGARGAPASPPRGLDGRSPLPARVALSRTTSARPRPAATPKKRTARKRRAKPARRAGRAAPRARTSQAGRKR
jgi:hypothetical protein